MNLLEDMDERCLEFEHDFPWMDMYDDEGAPYSPDVQMAARCERCGETLLHSLQRMRRTIQDMIESEPA